MDALVILTESRSGEGEHYVVGGDLREGVEDQNRCNKRCGTAHLWLPGL